MAEWWAFEDEDEEGNICFCVQKGDDKSTYEVLEYIEPDIAQDPKMIEQARDYMLDAKEEAQRRNEEGE